MDDANFLTESRNEPLLSQSCLIHLNFSANTERKNNKPTPPRDCRETVYHVSVTLASQPLIVSELVA